MDGQVDDAWRERRWIGDGLAAIETSSLHSSTYYYYVHSMYVVLALDEKRLDRPWLLLARDE